MILYLSKVERKVNNVRRNNSWHAFHSEENVVF